MMEEVFGNDGGSAELPKQMHQAMDTLQYLGMMQQHLFDKKEAAESYSVPPCWRGFSK